MSWTNDLCEYYGVSAEEADKLATRSNARKPSLPGSVTCEPVSGMTWEEIWDSKPRETEKQIFEFYRDIGSWQSFRQMKYRLPCDWRFLLETLIKANQKKVGEKYTILEYGCGIAPVSNWILDCVEGASEIFEFHVADVDSEHYDFGKWRLNKRNASIVSYTITPDNLPDFGSQTFDMILMLDVFEHVPSPLGVMKNIESCAHDKTLLLETWVDHTAGNVGYSDLQSAEDERETTINYLNETYHLVGDTPYGTRLWHKGEIVVQKQEQPQDYNKELFDTEWNE